MNWMLPKDRSESIISAKKHITSKHGFHIDGKIKETGFLFEMGYAIPMIQEKYPIVEVIEKLPCFLYQRKCVNIDGIENVSFIQGSYGAPASVDVLETVLELGVKRIVVVGFCGGIGKEVQVGELIVPNEIEREEGTSYHYLEPDQKCSPNMELLEKIYPYIMQSSSFKIHKGKTISTDAPYRETINKERSWQNNGILGVDMESSAILSVCQYYKIPAVSILMVSDKHNFDDNSNWEWDIDSMESKKVKFIELLMSLAKII